MIWLDGIVSTASVRTEQHVGNEKCSKCQQSVSTCCGSLWDKIKMSRLIQPVHGTSTVHCIFTAVKPRSNPIGPRGLTLWDDGA